MSHSLSSSASFPSLDDYSFTRSSAPINQSSRTNAATEHANTAAAPISASVPLASSAAPASSSSLLSTVSTLESIYQERVSLLTREYDHRLKQLCDQLIKAIGELRGGELPEQIERSLRGAIESDRESVIRRLTERLARSQAKAEHLQQQIIERGVADSAINQKDGEVAALQTRCGRLERLAGDLDRELQQANATNRVLNAEVARLNQLSQQLGDRLSAEQSAAVQGSAEGSEALRALRRELERKRDENVDLTQRLQQNEEKWTGRLEAAQRSTAKLSARLAALDSAFSAAKRDAVKYQAKAVEWKKKWETEKEKTEKYEAKLETLEGEREKMIAKQEAARAEAERKEEISRANQKRELQQLGESVRAEISKIQDQLTIEREEQARQQEQQLEQLRAAIQERSREINQWKSKYESLTRDYQEKNRESEAAIERAKSAEARAEMAQMARGAAEAATKQAKELEEQSSKRAQQTAAELDILRLRCAQLDQEIERVKSDSLRAERDATARLAACEEARAAELAATKRELERINTRNIEAKAKGEQMRERAERAENERDQMAERAREAEQQCAKLAGDVEARTLAVKSLEISLIKAKESIAHLDQESQQRMQNWERAKEAASMEKEKRESLESNWRLVINKMGISEDQSADHICSSIQQREAELNAARAAVAQLRSQLNDCEASLAIRAHEAALELEIAKVQATAPYKAEIEQLRAALKEFQAFHEAQLRAKEDEKLRAIKQQSDLMDQLNRIRGSGEADNQQEYDEDAGAEKAAQRQDSESPLSLSASEDVSAAVRVLSRQQSRRTALEQSKIALTAQREKMDRLKHKLQSPAEGSNARVESSSADLELSSFLNRSDLSDIIAASNLIEHDPEAETQTLGIGKKQ